MAESVLGIAGRLGSAADALAALGALVRIETEQLTVDPEVHSVLRAIGAELLGPDLVVTPEAAPALGLAQTFFAQGTELLRNPGRTGGWDQVDVPLLQGIGRMSMGVVSAVQAAAQAQPDLAARLAGPARILDVGTGAGWLAVALARAYPPTTVVGLDIFRPALDLARANVAGSDVADRIELREQDARDLAPTAEFDAVWLPLPFLPPAVVPDLLAAAWGALRPGGWLLAGTFAPVGEGRLAELLMDLRTVRSGGRPWTANDLLPLLAAAGYTDAHQVPRTWAAPVHLFPARRH